MILYIHGYGSSAKSYKAKVLGERLKEFKFLAPSLSYVPDLAISTLKDIIETYSKYEDIYLMGSSLGGYYAIYLAKEYNLPAILINPAINPTNTLDEKVGFNTNYFDKSKFETTKQHMDSLKKYEVKDIDEKLYFLLSKKGDEVLDYKEAEIKFKNSKSIIEDGGDHSFDDIDKYVDEMIEFYRIN